MNDILSDIVELKEELAELIGYGSEEDYSECDNPLLAVTLIKCIAVLTQRLKDEG